MYLRSCWPPPTGAGKILLYKVCNCTSSLNVYTLHQNYTLYNSINIQSSRVHNTVYDDRVPFIHAIISEVLNCERPTKHFTKQLMFTNWCFTNDNINKLLTSTRAIRLLRCKVYSYRQEKGCFGDARTRCLALPCTLLQETIKILTMAIRSLVIKK